MNGNDLVSAIIMGIVELITLLLGFVIYKYKAAEFVAGFNKEKHDHDAVSRIAGGNIIVMSLVLLIVDAVHIKAYEIITPLIHFVMFLLIIAVFVFNIIYRINRFAMLEVED